MKNKKNEETVAPGQVELTEVLDDGEAKDDVQAEEAEKIKTQEPSTKPVKKPPKKKLGLGSVFKKPKSLIVRINTLRTNDNRILVDLKTLESLIDNKIIEETLARTASLDVDTLSKVKSTLSDINDTAVLRIKEQNATGIKYVNNTIKELELESSKLFE